MSTPPLIPDSSGPAAGTPPAAPRGTGGGRPRVGLILRMIVSTVLIGLIVYRIDWASFAGTLRNTHVGYLTLSLAVSPALIVRCGPRSSL